MPNGTYGGVRGKETKIGRKTFVSLPTRLYLKNAESALQAVDYQLGVIEVKLILKPVVNANKKVDM